MQQLSALDASFLHLETPETPMHVGSLMLLELPKGYAGDYYEDLKRMIADRVHLSPLLTRKLLTMPFELAEPVWVEDDHIDISYHVRSLTLRRPGSLDQLYRLVARLHSSLLDRSRPLWEMYVIEGLEDGRVAFYTKAHHSGIDGKAGTGLLKVLYDVSPEIRKVPPPKRRHAGRGSQLGVTELLQAALRNGIERYRALADLAPAAARAYTAAGNILLSQQAAPGKRPLTLGLAPKTLFNDAITNQRSFAPMSVPFDEIKTLSKRVGGTINTVVMAMCGGALERFLKARGAMPKEPLIAGVPVSLRAEGDEGMDNQVTMVRVDLATDLSDLGERFKAIHASSEAGKAVIRELRPVLGVEIPMTGSPWIMTSMASLYGRSELAREIPPMASVVISNVPGPQQRLFVAGAEMISCYPVSIAAHGNALNMTVQSYAGSLDFGFIACQRVISQEEMYELAGYMRDALEDIKRLPSVDGAGAKAAAAGKVAAAPKKKTGTSVKAAGKPQGARKVARTGGRKTRKTAVG